MNNKTSQAKSATSGWLAIFFGGVQKSVDEAWVVRMIGGIFIAVLALNVAAAFVYVDEKSWSAYFDSKSYEALLATLLIPLLLAFVDRAFKVNERLRQEQRARQIETIEKTHAMWSELYSLSTEVAYFKSGHGQESLHDLRKKLECVTILVEEAVNLWYHFPDIEKDVQEVQRHALPGINLLLLSAMTVADVVEAGGPDAKHLQNCLLVIQDGVRSGLHYSLMQIFYFAMEDKPEDLKKQMAILRGWGEFFKQLINNLPPILPPSADTAALMGKRGDYQTAFELYTQAKNAYEIFADKLQRAPDDAARQQIRASAEFQAAVNAHDIAARAVGPLAERYRQDILHVPSTLLGMSRKRFFSDEQIHRFTAEIFFKNDALNIQTGA
jgi:hypothetical protein